MTFWDFVLLIIAAPFILGAVVICLWAVVALLTALTYRVD